MKRYQVVGGQYNYCWYGEADTLLGAKRLAGKHNEYAVQDDVHRRRADKAFVVPA